MAQHEEVKTKFITLRVTPAIRNKLKQMADRDQRPLTGLLNKLIHDAIEADERRR
jgi:hypothetical protein